jgi:dCMP deaminase
MTVDWHRRFMDLAYYVSQWSKDPTTKVGAVLVGPDRHFITGYNNLARGLDDNTGVRDEHPQKALWYEHAERNALYNANLFGISVKNFHLYVPWHPCCGCARALIQCRISVIIVEDILPSPQVIKRWSDEGRLGSWWENIKTSNEMLLEADVYVRTLDGSGIDLSKAIMPYTDTTPFGLISDG